MQEEDAAGAPVKGRGRFVLLLPGPACGSSLRAFSSTRPTPPTKRFIVALGISDRRGLTACLEFAQPLARGYLCRVQVVGISGHRGPPRGLTSYALGATVQAPRDPAYIVFSVAAGGDQPPSFALVGSAPNSDCTTLPAQVGPAQAPTSEFRLIVWVDQF